MEPPKSAHGFTDSLFRYISVRFHVFREFMDALVQNKVHFLSFSVSLFTRNASKPYNIHTVT